MVRSRYGRGMVMVRAWYGHGTVMVRSRYSHDAVKVLSRYAPGSLVVWNARDSFAQGILALHASSLYTLPSSLPSGCSRSLILHEKISNTDNAGK